MLCEVLCQVLMCERERAGEGGGARVPLSPLLGLFARVFGDGADHLVTHCCFVLARCFVWLTHSGVRFRQLGPKNCANPHKKNEISQFCLERADLNIFIFTI